MFVGCTSHYQRKIKEFLCRLIFIFSNLVCYPCHYFLLHIDAAKTYFTSLIGLARMRDSGKYNAKCIYSAEEKDRLLRVKSAVFV